MSGVKRGPCLSELFRVGLETFRTLRTSGLFCVGRMSPYAPDVGAFLCRSDVPIRSGHRGYFVSVGCLRALRSSGLFCVGRMPPHAPDVGAILCRSDVPIRSGRRGFFMPVCEACPRASVRAGRCPDVGQGGLRRIHSILSVLRLRFRFPSPVPAGLPCRSESSLRAGFRSVSCRRLSGG